MLTRYQINRELYNQVLDEPNMLGSILKHLDPTDIVHLSLSGESDMTRFHDTIQIVLDEKKITKKMETFAREVALCIDQVLLAPGDNRGVIDNLFEYLIENMWYKDGLTLQSFDRMVEIKLIEFAMDERYSHSALNCLSLLFDIHVRCVLLDDDDLVEYIVDSTGNTYFI